MKSTRVITKAALIFKRKGGILTTALAARLGIAPRTLYAMRDLGLLERLDHGLYRLVGVPPHEAFDLVTVRIRVPKAVVCLISALSLYGLTTQVPHEVQVALQRGDQTPRISFPPIRVFRFSSAAYAHGIDRVRVGGVALLVYSPEKTLADCLRYRGKIGLDTALEGMKSYVKRGRVDVSALLHFARICRVERLMSRYLEALL